MAQGGRHTTARLRYTGFRADRADGLQSMVSRRGISRFSGSVLAVHWLLTEADTGIWRGLCARVCPLLAQLIAGYRLHLAVPGLYGFSVQYANDKTVEDLARAGRFPHGRISYATDDTLAAVLLPLGYTMRLVRSPGQGYHHTFAVLYDKTGMPLQSLPEDAAIALSAVFQHQRNPYQTR